VHKANASSCHIFSGLGGHRKKPKILILTLPASPASQRKKKCNAQQTKKIQKNKNSKIFIYLETFIE
tara:strand:+ start:396 stop:596 length:201 start_codon:yes stop_codon:yes gene_type:complete